MSSNIRVALIGYSGIGRIHSLCYQSLPFIYPDSPFQPQLYAVCTSQEQTAAKAAKEGGFVKSTTNIQDILTDPAVDVIDICLPNHLHLPVFKQAAAAKKHIYCEKPLAGTIADAQAITELANNTHTQCGMVFQYRFFPAIIKAKNLINEGKIGRIFTYRAEYLHAGYENPDRPLTWRMKKEEGGSGALGDLGSHVIDLIRCLVGEFTHLQAVLHTFIKERPTAKGAAAKAAVTVDDAAWITAKMENDAVGSIEASRFATGTLDDLRLWIYGEYGSLHFNLMDPNFLYWYDNTKKAGEYGGSRGWQKIDTVQNYPNAKAPPPRAPIGWHRAHAENQYRFLQAVYENRPPEPSINDGFQTQAVIHAAERSHARLGERVTVLHSTESSAPNT